MGVVQINHNPCRVVQDLFSLTIYELEVLVAIIREILTIMYTGRYTVAGHPVIQPGTKKDENQKSLPVTTMRQFNSGLGFC